MKTLHATGLAALLSAALLSGQALAADTQPIWQQYVDDQATGFASDKGDAPIWQEQLDALRRHSGQTGGYAIETPNRPIWSGHVERMS